MICARYFEPHSNFEQIETMTTTCAALTMTMMGEDVGRLRWMMVENEDCRLVM